MKISAPDAFCQKSGPSTASSDLATPTRRFPMYGTTKPSHALLAESEVVQTTAYTNNVSILEALIAPEHSGRI